MAGIYIKYPATSGSGSTGSSTGVSYQVGPLDGAAANSNGATIGSNFLYMQSATPTFPGVVSSATQTFGGVKRFQGNVTIGSVSAIQPLNVGVSGTSSAFFAGNVGIATSSASYALDVNGFVRSMAGFGMVMQNPSNTGESVIKNTATSGQNNMTFTTGGSERMQITFGGNVTVGSVSAIAPFNVGISGSNSAYFAGNIGVGKSNPICALDVAGQIASRGWMQIFNSSNTASLAGGDGRSALIFGANDQSNWMFLGAQTGDTAANTKFGLYSWPLADWVMTWTNSGTVGIGTTVPAVKFDVRGSAQFYNDVAVTGSTSVRIREGAGQANSEVFGVYSNDLATPRMNIRNGVVCIGSTSPTALLNVSSSSGLSAFFSGNVGIGLNNPTVRLQVTGAAIGAAPAIVCGGDFQTGFGAASGGSIFFGSAGFSYNTGDYIRQSAVGRLEFMAGGSSASSVQMVVNFGNVGIGVLAPSQKLDVVGNIKGNGFIVGSTTVTASTGGSAYSIKLPGTQGSNSSVLANDGAGNLNWQVFGGAPQSYTPTIAGLGTVTSISFTAQRMFGNAVIRGTFTTGTGFAASALTISLPAGVAVSNRITPIYTYMGQAASEGITAYLPILARAGETMLSIGANSGPACLTPQNGTSIYLALSKGSIYAIIPVEGWT